MGGGGPLAFLNKKTWHTGSLRVIEEVWKREQEKEAEGRKLEELRKQLEDERQREELDKVAEAAGHTTKSSRLDWMYAGGIAAKGDADRRKQDADAMSKPVQLETTEEKISRCEQVSLLPSFYTEDTPKSANEAWARLNNDPLFLIKRQERAAMQRIKSNPVQMDAIKTEVKKLRDMKKSKKSKKSKKEKKEKKSKKSSKKRKHSSSPSASELSDDMQLKKIKKNNREKIEGKNSRRDDRRHERDGHRDSDYGLEGKLDSSQQYEASRRAQDTRRRLEEAARKKEEELRTSNQRHHRQEYKVGRISREEQAKRLAEMSQNAEKREEIRKDRLLEARHKEAAEKEYEEKYRERKKPTDFAHNTAGGLYSGSVRSLEESVTSRKYYSQRGRDGDRHAFRK